MRKPVADRWESDVAVADEGIADTLASTFLNDTTNPVKVLR